MIISLTLTNYLHDKKLPIRQNCQRETTSESVFTAKNTSLPMKKNNNSPTNPQVETLKKSDTSLIKRIFTYSLYYFSVINYESKNHDNSFIIVHSILCT